MSKRDFISLNKEIDKIIKDIEKSTFKGYKEALDKLKKEMSELYEKHSVNGKLIEDVMLKYNRMQALEKDIQISIALMYERNNKEIARGLKQAFRDTSKSLIETIGKETGRQLTPITKARDVNKTINEAMKGLNWVERQGKHRMDLIYDIQKTVKEGLANGDTYRTMANRLNKSMDMSINKSNTIVRTETARVNAVAQKETLDKVKDAGIKMMKTWNAVGDERVRASHAELDGVTIPYEDDFITPLGNRGFGPKQLDDDGEDSINCRCFLTITFE